MCTREVSDQVDAPVPAGRPSTSVLKGVTKPEQGIWFLFLSARVPATSWLFRNAWPLFDGDSGVPVQQSRLRRQRVLSTCVVERGCRASFQFDFSSVRLDVPYISPAAVASQLNVPPASLLDKAGRGCSPAQKRFGKFHVLVSVELHVPVRLPDTPSCLFSED